MVYAVYLQDGGKVCQVQGGRVGTAVVCSL